MTAGEKENALPADGSVTVSQGGKLAFLIELF
jgi:hypothetical protein